MRGLAGFYCNEIDGHLWAYINRFSQCFTENNIGDEKNGIFLLMCKTREGWLDFLSLQKPDKVKKLFQTHNN